MFITVVSNLITKYLILKEAFMVKLNWKTFKNTWSDNHTGKKSFVVSFRRINRTSMAGNTCGFYLAGTVKNGGRMLASHHAPNTKWKKRLVTTLLPDLYRSVDRRTPRFLGRLFRFLFILNSMCYTKNNTHILLCWRQKTKPFQQTGKNQCTINLTIFVGLFDKRCWLPTI